MSDLLSVLRTLKLKQIRLLFNDGSFSWKALNSWKGLEDALSNLNSSERDILLNRAVTFKKEVEEKRLMSIEAKKLLKAQQRDARRAEHFEEDRARRTRRSEGVVYEHMYPDVVGEDVQLECLQIFCEHLSDEFITQAVCACCAGKFDRVETSTIPVDEIPNRDRLRPRVDRDVYRLTNGLLLYPDAVVLGMTGEHDVQLCHSCLESLQADKTPRLSLVNNMWVGNVPTELSVLRIPERLLVSLYYPSAYIVKLFPPTPGASSWENWDFNLGLRGNVSTYKLDTLGVHEMARGNLMPHPLEILASRFSVTVVGPKDIPDPAWQDVCEVSRKRVLDALLWLKKNNPLYHDITIDESVLARLPQCGVPDSISHNIKHVDTHISQDEDGCFLNRNDVDDNMDGDVHRHHVSPETSLNEMMEEQLDGRQESAVIALTESAVVDVDGFDIPEADLLQEALNNATQGSSTSREDPAYKILRGTDFVNEYPRRNEFGQEVSMTDNSPNHLLGAFPTLFPYGCGGFETERDERVSYVEHAQWAMRFADGRFARDISFLAQVFGVMQKRQVCLGADLQVRRQDYKRHERSINSISVKNLQDAVYEENQGMPPSNDAVRVLKSFVKATRKHVMGTDENRMANRSKIEGMTVMMNPPNIWMTITCDDVNDPIVQILSGVNISLDNFNAASGPNHREQLKTSTKNPFATTTFFFRIIKHILEDLLGIKSASRRGRIERERGIFGTVSGYVSMVEAQGRGSLHLHLILWLQGSPSATELTTSLRDELFRNRLAAFISQNIKAHVPGLNAEYVSRETSEQKSAHKQRASAYSRPLHPSMDNFDHARWQLEFSLARSVQVHKCRAGVCLVPDKHGRVRCKRRAPWDLSPSDVVYESGLWLPEREYGFLNSWNPIILLTTRSNNDIKLLTNAPDTRHVTYYITKYAVKPQAKTYHATALLATRMAYMKRRSEDDNDIRKRNKKMLSQCAHALNRAQELSSQQMVAYIMGFGDRVMSHRFVPIYLSGALWVLENNFPEFHQRRTVHLTESDSPGESTADSEDTPELHQVFSSYSLQMTSNGLQVKSQLTDYQWRGTALRHLSFLSFLLESYEPRNFQYNEHTNLNERVPYLSGSPFHDGRLRILRNPDAEMMPDFLGACLPRSDREEDHKFYCASVLLLLKPWGNLSDLKIGFSSWKDAFDDFVSHTTPRFLRIIDNFQFHHQSYATAVLKASEETDHIATHEITALATDDVDGAGYIPGVHFGSAEFISVDLDAIAESTEAPGEAYHGDRAIEIAEDLGIFTEDTDEWSFLPSDLSKSSMELLTQNFRWQESVETWSKDKDYLAPPEASLVPSSIIGLQDSSLPSGLTSVVNTIQTNSDTDDYISQQLFQPLTVDQRRACEIVFRHLSAYLSGLRRDPLFMLICGSGGVGKSTVIRTIQTMFAYKNASQLLCTTATSGVAATHVHGQTVHWWGGVPICLPKVTNFTDKASRAIAERRLKNIKDRRYLIIDEVSMLCQDNLGVLEQIIKYSSGSDNRNVPFGGDYSIILIGDFHQFPPVGKLHSALFKSTPGNSIWASRGFDIFQNFRTVVLLTEQKRVVDSVWNSILERLRYGGCTADDIKVIQTLVLTEPRTRAQDNNPDFHSAPWKDAILVTPRHGVRNRWNRASVKKYASANKKQLFVCPVEHILRNGVTIEKHSHPEITLSLAMDEKRLSKTLPRKVYMAIGLRILLTFNIAVNADLANGTLGTIVNIFLDPREPVVPSSAMHQLKFPPRLIFFRPDRTQLPALPGLEQGIIPIQPSLNGFVLTLPSGSEVHLKRKQYPITPAYSFTDYKAQGQTISPLILDLRQPFSSGLSQFNLYVALSRGVSREFTRILSTPDTSLFTTPPDEDLIKFDKKLHEWNEATKVMYGF